MQKVTIITPSRLHFGLLSFNNPNVTPYGGLGLMIDRPSVRLVACRSPNFFATGKHSMRVRQFATTWSEFYATGLPNCHIDVIDAPDQHVGLGVGTQLGLAIATALNQLFRTCETSFDELAKSVDRGQRSSIGTIGFHRGGLIFELGKTSHQTIADDITRLKINENWRVLLIRPSCKPGLSGEGETSAFASLPAVPIEVTDRLTKIVRERILPSAKSSDFDAFSEALYEYGIVAGECFAKEQGGPFASDLLAKMVRTMREYGIKGVGQSSWGPTLFAFHSDLDAAERSRNVLSRDFGSNVTVSIASANVDGFKLELGG